MKNAIRLANAVFLFTALANLSAQELPADCVSASDDRLVRLSGRIVRVHLEHPLGHYTLDGYGLSLSYPICFTTFSRQSGETIRLTIDQVGLLSIFSSHWAEAREKFWENGRNRHRWEELDRFVETNVGSLMTVIGTIEDDPSPARLVEPQIAVGWYAACEIEPKTSSVEKC